MRASEFIIEAPRDQRLNDPKIISDVKQAYDMGLKLDDISRVVDIPYTIAKRILDLHYRERVSNPRPKRYSDGANAIIAAWDSGLKSKQIAIKLGIPREKVVSVLQDRYPNRIGKQVQGKYIKPEILTPDEQTDLISQWREGSSVTSVAKKYNIHPTVLAPWIKTTVGPDEYNKTISNRGYSKQTLSSEDVRDIIDLYTSGESISDIAKSYNTLYNTIKYHLMKQGKIAPADNAIVSPATIDKMVDLKKAGYSVAQIGQKLDIGYSTVRHYLRGRI